MTINEYQHAALRTANTKEDIITNCALGLTGEAGEVADHVKKAMFQGHELDPEHIAKELGDISWYVAVMAYAIGYNLEQIFQMNVDKLWKRYPEGFDAERSINREENKHAE